MDIPHHPVAITCQSRPTALPADDQAILFIIIAFEFEAYVLTRQVVNLFEWFFAWRGHKRLLRKELRQARTYEAWVRAAKRLDAYLGFDEWKETDEDSYFDYILVSGCAGPGSADLAGEAGKEDSVPSARGEGCQGLDGCPGSLCEEQLCRYRRAKDVQRGVLSVSMPWKLIQRPFMAPSTLSSRTSAKWSHRSISSALPRTSRRKRNERSSAPSTKTTDRALCASLEAPALVTTSESILILRADVNSFGVVKAFLEADLLPRVITGTSAGGIVAALLCTRTDEELKQLLVPRLADKITACEDPFTVWFKRFWQTGARFSTLEWARKVRLLMGRYGV